MAKGVTIESIPTPFGQCDFKKLRGNNYIAKSVGVAQAVTTYEALLYIINNFKLNKKINNEIIRFVNLKVDDNFFVNDVGDRQNIKKQLESILIDRIKTVSIHGCNELFEDKDHFFKKNFNITYGQAAAIFCGALAISETVRSGGSGKMVRGGLTNDVTKFSESYPRAKKKGNVRTSEVLINQTEDSSIENALPDISPESTLLE